MTGQSKARFSEWWTSTITLALLVQALLHWRDIATALVTRSFWLDLGWIFLLTLAACLAFAAIVYAFVKFCQWFDAALTRERARIDRRVAAYHGGHAPGGDEVMRDAELDG